MILFVAGSSGDIGVAERALRSLVERLPFFPGRPVETWSHPGGGSCVAWVAHGPEQTGGVEYVAAERERLALFAGRPILWTGDREADGRAAIDPRRYLAGFSAEALDGRFAVVRAGAEGVEAVTDTVGAYPLYEAEAAGARWISNNATLLRDMRGGGALDLDSLAGLIGGGWPLDGHPAWAGVRRVAFEEASVRPGAGLDVERAVALLTAASRALADWPGRPQVVPLTAGRDSRLVLAAALAAGNEFDANTGGNDDAPDVVTGRRLAELARVRHSLIGEEGMWHDWRRGAELIALMAGGTASLADAAGFPLHAREGILPIWHSGQGGEVARAYYGTGEGLDRAWLAGLLADRHFLGRRPGRSGVLSADAQAVVRRQVEVWVAGQLDAGIAAADVPDMFYLRRRMGTWAGTGHGCVEFVRDTTSPLWSARLLRDELGAPAPERAREVFHRRVMEQLAPSLVDVPFEGGRGWPGERGAVARRADRARALARKALAEARRRAGVRGAYAGNGKESDPFGPILAEIRDVVLSQPDHAAWPLLDRPRVERLLASDAATLDAMSRYYAWRLATVFGGLRAAPR
ncbi:MAG: hypothetical protein QOD53_2473 [Thermoleophilaceae bacterium]|nr:hypothetical protein [Thermoleophilaceae bacterium]